jgi:hypothetical protein
MGGAAILPAGVPCAKGWVPFSLDQCSKGRGARARLEGLNRAIASLAPDYQGLTDVFNDHLLVRSFRNASLRQRIVTHLRTHWFGPNSREAYFPNQKVAEIYAQGVLKAVDLSLKGRRRPVPINTWWIVDFKEVNRQVKMLTLVDAENEVTVGGEVTLLILTPRPRGDGESGGTFILGEEAEAWVSEQQGENVVTLRVRDLR